MAYNKKIIMIFAWKLVKTKKITISEALKKSWFKYKFKSGNLYKSNLKTIKKYCYIYSKYFNTNYEDLFSEANKIYMDCSQKYTFNKISFDDYLRNSLKRNLRFFCLNEYHRIEREYTIKNKLKIEYSNIENNIELKHELNFDEKIKKIINEIIDFCSHPNFKEIIIPYSKIGKQQVSKKLAIQEYFKKVYSYKRFEILQAFDNITYMLKKEMI